MYAYDHFSYISEILMLFLKFSALDTESYVPLLLFYMSMYCQIPIFMLFSVVSLDTTLRHIDLILVYASERFFLLYSCSNQVVRALDILNGVSDLTIGVKPCQIGIFSLVQYSTQI